MSSSNTIAMPSLFLNSTQKGRGERTISLNLSRGLFFPEVERIYAQVTQAVIPYSMINISKELYNNACFQITGVFGPALNELVLDEGVYPSITELEQAMNWQIFQILSGFAPPPTGFDIEDRDTYFVRLEANTTTNKITLYLPTLLPTPSGANPNLLSSITPTCGDGSHNLFSELGFLPTAGPFVQGNNSAVLLNNTSTEPITFLDILASGLYIVCEDDLQVLSYFDDLANSNVLAQVPLTNDDLVGGQILYPRDLQVIQCPLVEGKSVKKFKIRIISPRDPTRDVIFMQGDFSCVLSFHAVY